MIVAAIYAVVQPDLFESGLAIFEELADHAEELNESIGNALSAWATPFTGLSVILNQETITHLCTLQARQGWVLSFAMELVFIVIYL